MALRSLTLVIDNKVDGAAYRKVQEESCKENGAAVTDLVIDLDMYGEANRKVLEESCKKMALLSLTLVIDIDDRDVWSRQEKGRKC
jgi:hypothetical protein